MAIKSTAAATSITKAGAPSGATPYTVFARKRPDASSNYGAFCGMTDAFNANQNGVFFNAGGLDLLVVGGTTAALPLTTTLGTWYDIAITCAGGTGAGAFIGYAQRTGSPAALVSAAVTPMGTSIQPQINIGGGTGGEFLTGATADVMVWTVQLTAAELERQRTSRAPCVRLESLYANPDTSHAEGRLLDLSGNCRHFVTTATLTVDDPPVENLLPWRAPHAKVVYVPAAGGGVTGTLDATVRRATSASTGTVAVSATGAVVARRATSVATGIIQVAGTAVASVPRATASGTGAVTATAALAASVRRPTGSALGTVTVSAALAASGPRPLGSAAGTIRVAGVAAGSVQRSTCVATGTVGGALGVAGAIVATVRRPTVAATGTVRIAGTGAAVTQRARSAATGTVRVTGALAAPAQRGSASATGTVSAPPGAFTLALSPTRVILAPSRTGVTLAPSHTTATITTPRTTVTVAPSRTAVTLH